VTSAELTALIVAVTGLVAAVGTTLVQVNRLTVKIDRNHELLNGRIGELLNVSTMAAKKQGELEGRDWATRTTGIPPTLP
jgi:hypothetical protein